MLDFLDLSFIVISIICILVVAIILESFPEEYRLKTNNKLILSFVLGLSISFLFDYQYNSDTLLTSNYWD